VLQKSDFMCCHKEARGIFVQNLVLRDVIAIFLHKT